MLLSPLYSREEFSIKVYIYLRDNNDELVARHTDSKGAPKTYFSLTAKLVYTEKIEGEEEEAFYLCIDGYDTCDDFEFLENMFQWGY